MAEGRSRRDLSPDSTVPSVARPSDTPVATQLKGRAPVDATQISEKGDATRVAGSGPADAAAPIAERTDQHIVQGVTLEKELLEELRRINHQLASITNGYRRYTLSFFSGVVRGLGAAIGATVVFAVFLAAVSRLDTTPVIGNYVRRVVNVVRQAAPVPGNHVELNPFLDDEESPTPAASPAASETPAASTTAPATTTTAPATAAPAAPSARPSGH